MAEINSNMNKKTNKNINISTSPLYKVCLKIKLNKCLPHVILLTRKITQHY